MEAAGARRAWHPGAQADWAVRVGRGVGLRAGRPVCRLSRMWPAELKLVASASVPLGQACRSWLGGEACDLGASVMRARLFRKARDQDAGQWAWGWHAPRSLPSARFRFQALWAGAVWVFLWKRRLFGLYRGLADSRLVNHGGAWWLLLLAVRGCVSGGRRYWAAQPLRRPAPLRSGAARSVGRWQDPQVPVPPSQPWPPALAQRGPGSAPSWPGAAAARPA